MKLFRGNLDDLTRTGQPVIGFWGVPPRDVLEAVDRKHDGLEFFDLDVFYSAPKSGAVPDAFCHIIRNCVDNAAALGDQLRCVVAATGAEKCDAGRFAARMVSGVVSGEVMSVKNEEPAPSSQPLLCESKGPLKKRIVRIMNSIIEPLDERERTSAFMVRCEPTHGFWGTPPHPIEMLDLFPDTTHVFGWTRCVEQGCPADLEAEMTVPEGLPIIFFSQGFCAKSILARQLAESYGGMHVDVHDSMGAASIAKIEAFIRLSVEEN